MKSKLVRITLCLVLVGVLLITLQYPVARPVPLGASQIGRFSSYEELRAFVKTNAQWVVSPWIRNGIWLQIAESRLSLASAPLARDLALDYSSTNIQVAGVDEADIVKTDGEYIYLVSGQKIIIVKAYPPEEARVLSEISLNGTGSGIFIKGDKLVVFEEIWPRYDVVGGGEARLYLRYVSPKVTIKVYDISDREDPQLRREVSADGQYVSSRMIGNYTYVVITESVYERDGEISLPKISLDGDEQEVRAADIYYSNVSDHSYMFTTIIAINTQNDDQEPTQKTILVGSSSTLYVSRDNIYLTFPVWGGDLGGEWWGRRWSPPGTSIHRIHIEGDKIEFVASGEVPGAVLNQFSMDEYEGYFRVATTSQEETSRNNVYILDMELDIVGRLEGLAPTETIYSARFMGEKGYLVTFQVVDPLFVIDLSDPRNPQVLGELKITGYSDYLHPYDENYLIGIGKEAVAAEEGNFAWDQAIKISLFDVSDVNNPKEIGKYEIGDRGTHSPVLRDHKAFLFDKSRNLMVIPVLVAEIDEAEYPGEVPAWAYGKAVWQGAYVFHVSPEVGFRLEGRITHIDNIADLQQDYYYFYSSLSVKRSLYIGDVLYTISDAKIKMHSLEDLAYINEVELPVEPEDHPILLPSIGEEFPELRLPVESGDVSTVPPGSSGR